MQEMIEKWLMDPVVGKVIMAVWVALVVVVLMRYTQKAPGRYIDNSEQRYRIRRLFHRDLFKLHRFQR